MKYIKLRLLNIVMNYYFNKYQMTINSAVTKKGKNVMNEKLETKNIVYLVVMILLRILQTMWQNYIKNLERWDLCPI